MKRRRPGSLPAAYPNASDDFLRQVFFLHSTPLMKNREGRQLVGCCNVMLIMATSALSIGGRDTGRGGTRSASRATLMGSVSCVRGVSCTAWPASGGSPCLPLSKPWRLPRVSGDGMKRHRPLSVARDLHTVAAAIKVQPVKDTQPLPIDDAIVMAREVPGARLAFALPDDETRSALSHRAAAPRPGTASRRRSRFLLTPGRAVQSRRSTRTPNTGEDDPRGAACDAPARVSVCHGRSAHAASCPRCSPQPAS